MLRAGWKSLMARKLRLFMSATAIILGVAFVAGSLIFTDTLGRAFTGITSGSVGDVIVRPTGASSFGEGFGTSITVPATLVPRLAAAPGAARADGNVTSFGTFVVSKAGKLIGGNGAPGIAFNHTGGPAAHEVQAVTLDAGRWPSRAGEVALDATTAQKAGYLIGETVPLVSSGAEPRISARLVGTATFGGGGLIGASIAIFDTRTAQQLFLGGRDAYSDVWVSARDGVSQAELRAQVAKALPPGYEAVTGDAAAEAAANQIQKALGFITTFLLVFAGIALVVGSFLIVNTFSILVAQRGRELALFRALGAARAQVARSVIFEAFVVGLFGSTVGLGLGVLLAIGIKALFARFGLDLSGSPLQFRPRTALAAYGVGIVVTLVAAYLPARRAGKVSPVAAMRADVEVGETSLRRRLVLGAALAAIGAAALGTGLFTGVDHRMWFIGLGILGVVLGVAMTSPLVGRPVIAVLGAAYRRVFGAVGAMAELNAVRNPRRTAATASALMIGVTLVSMMAVVGASAKASIDKVIDEEFVADFVVSNVIGQPFSPAVTRDVAEVPGVARVTPLRYDLVRVGTRPDAFVGGADPATLSGVVPLVVTSGSLSALTDSSMLVEAKRAREQGLRLGQSVPVTAEGRRVTFTVAGTYTDSQVLGTHYLLSTGGLARVGAPEQDSVAYVSLAPGADREAVQAAIEAVIKDLPLVTLKDQAAYAQEQRQPVDQLLYIIYALLGLAIVIAVLGIVNTLGLSVIERTREIGLLRAIGLARSQLRRMLVLESVVIAVLGAVLGIVLGVGFGVALQVALADEGVTELAIPTTHIALFLALAVVVGVLAALWPARRAARLDILRAVSEQ